MNIRCRIARVILRCRAPGDAGSGWLDRHLRDCLECSAEAREIEGLASLLRDSLADTEDCAAGWEQVRAKLEPRTAPARVRMQPAAVAATLAVAVLASSALVAWWFGARHQLPTGHALRPNAIVSEADRTKPAAPRNGTASGDSVGAPAPAAKQPSKPAVRPQPTAPKPRITLPPPKRWFAQDKPAAPTLDATAPEPKEAEIDEQEPVVAVVRTEEYVMDVVGTSADADSGDIYAIHQVAASPPDSDGQLEL